MLIGYLYFFCELPFHIVFPQFCGIGSLFYCFVGAYKLYSCICMLCHICFHQGLFSFVYDGFCLIEDLNFYVPNLPIFSLVL